MEPPRAVAASRLCRSKYTSIYTISKNIPIFVDPWMQTLHNNEESFITRQRQLGESVGGGGGFALPHTPKHARRPSNNPTRLRVVPCIVRVLDGEKSLEAILAEPTNACKAGRPDGTSSVHVKDEEGSLPVEKNSCLPPMVDNVRNLLPSALRLGNRHGTQ